MHLKSPLANNGFNRLPASVFDLSLLTIVCNSSINRITPFSLLLISLNNDLKRSSNCPRNLAPAINAPISSEISLRP